MIKRLWYLSLILRLGRLEINLIFVISEKKTAKQDLMKIIFNELVLCLCFQPLPYI